MRVLILTQMFAPEPDLKGLPFARELIAQGHQVEVLTGFPNMPQGRLHPGYSIRPCFREIFEGVSVLRVPLYPSHDASAVRRALTYLSFALSATLLGPWLVAKADVMYVYQVPATITLPAIVIGFLRRIPFVYDIQDIWPETLTAGGIVLSGWVLSLVKKWCGFAHRRAARIVVHSQGYRDLLSRRGVPPEKVEVIPNWCDERQVASSDLGVVEDALLDGKFNIVFAGNVGKAQALSTVVEAAVILHNSQPWVQFVFVGDGVEKPLLQELVERYGVRNVHFLPWRPTAEVGALMKRADALLVHLKRDPLFDVTIPSKIQAYLAIGRPILGGVRGDAARLVHDAGAGLVFEPERPEDLANAVKRLETMTPAERERMGENGRRYYSERFTLTAGTGRFVSLFERVMTSQRCRHQLRG